MDITPQYDFEIALIIGILFTFAFSGSIVALLFFVSRNNLKQKIVVLEEKRSMQQKFTKEIIESEERTKQNLAAELHDDIGSALTAIKIMLFKHASKSSPSENFKDQQLIQIADEVTDIISKVRNISMLLLPQEFDEHSLKEALDIYLPKIAKAAKAELEWSISESNESILIADKLALFRIIQEAISNALKYSKASTISIHLKIVESKFELNITDNGIGFVQDKVSLGLGLNNIKARTDAIGANLSIATSPNNGVSINVVR